MYRSIVIYIMTTKKGTVATESKVKQPKLKLKNVEVVFANMEDVGASLSAVVILSGRKTGADADLNELLNEAQEREFVQGDEFVQKEIEQAESAKDDLPF